MEIIESKEFKELCNLENQYRKSLKSGYTDVKWLIPEEQLHRHSFATFPDYVKDEDFDDLNNLMVNFLHFVCKRRHDAGPVAFRCDQTDAGSGQSGLAGLTCSYAISAHRR